MAVSASRAISAVAEHVIFSLFRRLCSDFRHVMAPYKLSYYYNYCYYLILLLLLHLLLLLSVADWKIF